MILSTIFSLIMELITLLEHVPNCHDIPNFNPSSIETDQGESHSVNEESSSEESNSIKGAEVEYEEIDDEHRKQLKAKEQLPAKDYELTACATYGQSQKENKFRGILISYL